MIIAGIDPGKMGAIAFVDYPEYNDSFAMDRKKPHILEICDCPVFGDQMDCIIVVELIKKHNPYHIAIERSQPMIKGGIKQGVVSTFSIGYNFGQYIGIIAGLGIPYTLVFPQSWKKEFFLLKKPKEASIIEASRLFPWEPKYFTRKKDHGRADAVLIAEVVRRKLSGNILKFGKIAGGIDKDIKCDYNLD